MADKGEGKRKKIDNRIRVLIQNGVNQLHRSMFVIVGQKARDQVVILHHMLSKSTVKARPNVLWCYKKNLGFTSHRQKRMKEIQKKIRNGSMDVNEQDPFELFIASTNIRYCYYNETHKILGQTFGMVILQDFEAITPNILARTIETVEGGGMVCILLHTIDSLKQLYTMSMDVHCRYRTEVHNRVVNRFNERFLLSLSSHPFCLVVDDKLNILPLSTLAGQITPTESRVSDSDPSNMELKSLKESLEDTPISPIVNLCVTTSQIKSLLVMIDVLAEKSMRSTVALTAGRGRGKSAALGLSIAVALATGYCNIFVTSPSPENLKTLFEFVIKGFDAMKYQQHTDYEVIQSTNPDFKKCIVRIILHTSNSPRQIVQYIHPQDYKFAAQAELLIVDEAAAIPLPLVKQLMGPYMVFLSSTVSGYEGTGRSLSLKLIDQLRKNAATAGSGQSDVRTLKEFTLEESIRYKPGDECEKWLNRLLCLEATMSHVSRISGCPPPEDCQLFYINRDTLFSYHAVSEAFLQELMAMYVASHYKNSPNDLQLLSDAPAHHLFALLAPVTDNSLPQVLCVIQLCYEGGISEDSAKYHLSRDQLPSGDLIPWTISQQFQDSNFASYSGARIVRIATHPDMQSMGYGKRAMNQLISFFQGLQPSLKEDAGTLHTIDEINDGDVEMLPDEKIAPRKSLPPLLLKLSEFKPRPLDYLGVSYGITPQLHKFWKSLDFKPLYVRQTANELTGEHSCIMVRSLSDDPWLSMFYRDFRKRYCTLLGYQLRDLDSKLVSSMLLHDVCNDQKEKELTLDDFNNEFTAYDLKRLEKYCSNLADYHLIMDMLPMISKWFFLGRLPTIHLSLVQQCILVALGLQHKTVDDVTKMLEIDSVQCLGLFNRAMRKFLQIFRSMLENEVETEHFAMEESGHDLAQGMVPLKKSLKDDLNEAAESVMKKSKEDLIKQLDLSQYAIKGTDEEWSTALGNKGKALISIKSIAKRTENDDVETQPAKKKKFLKKHGKPAKITVN